MKKCIAAALILALLLSGCSWEEPDYVPDADLQRPGHTPEATLPPAEEQEIFALAYWPDRTLNPYQCTDMTNRVLFNLIYQGLFTVTAEYEARPMLCTSYNVSNDLRSWTFRVTNATFSDGTAVTGEDVRASLEASMGSPWYGNRLQHVQSITALGDSVMIQMKIPCENLPLLLDIPIVKASQVDAERPLGTGPYRYDGDQLRRQAGWWCDATLPIDQQVIPLMKAESTAQIRNLFEQSNVGLVCTDPGLKGQADFHRNYELWSRESGEFVYMMCSDRSEIFENQALRAALTYAIDRDKLARDHYKGFAYPASLPASPKSPFYDQKLASQFGFNPDKFAEAVAGANLEGKEIILMVSSADQNKLELAQAVADMFAAGGMTVKLFQVHPRELINQLRWGKYDLFIGQTTLSPNMDLTSFFATNGSLSYGGLSDETVNTLCKKALENTGNYYSLHKLIMENGWLCPILFRSTAVYGARGATTGLKPARDAALYYDLGLKLSDIFLSA